MPSYGSLKYIKRLVFPLDLVDPSYMAMYLPFIYLAVYPLPLGSFTKISFLSNYLDLILQIYRDIV